MNAIARRIMRVKSSPFYREWHFELGIIVLFVGLVLVLVVALVAVVGTRSTREELERQALAGAQAHRALCANAVSLEQAKRRNEVYLTLTPEQRINRLGIPASLADLPPALIRQNIAGERRTLRSYRGLECST